MSTAADKVILDRSRPMRERLETAARQWVASGRGFDGLMTGIAFFMAQCWLNAGGGEGMQQAVSEPGITDLVAASKAALGGDAGWNAMLSQRDLCRECQMAFRLENLGICTECAEYVCGACRGKHTACGGEVVG